jgi:2-oxoglutarate ferredoxin oxidoreductase subunit beta
MAGKSKKDKMDNKNSRKNKKESKKFIDIHYSRDKYSPIYEFTHTSDVAKHGIHPIDGYLRPGRIPHIWCAGCGLGSIMTCFIQAIKELELDSKKIAIVSGIGCSGRVAGYMNLDTYHTTHGRAIPFATGLKLAKPDMHVVVFSGDGDLFAIGGNHFIHAARRNVDIDIICVNNYNYAMTGGQSGPTTPISARTTTTPYGNIEYTFNLPHVAIGSGAVFVARWTALHVRRLKDTFKEAILKKGFTFTEVLSPCPSAYNRMNKLGDGLDEMKFYKEHSVIKHGADPQEADLGIHTDIVCGKFIDIDKPTFRDMYQKELDFVREQDEKKALTTKK